MDEHSILIAQINALSRNLKRAEATLKNAAISDELRRRVDICFGTQIDVKQAELTTLLEQVRHDFSDRCWNQFKNIRDQCIPLFAECLAFLEGALIRSFKIDEGLCDIADALLHDLSYRTGIPYQRFSLLAEGEFLSNMTDIIRLRFPEFSVWNLPLIGHEFGHIVGRELRRRISPDPFKAIIHSEGKLQLGLIDESFLNEQFADLFATYALGPSFACTCILLNFAPESDLDKPTHPSNPKRVYFILKALEKLNQVNDWAYQGIIEYLQEAWQKSLISAGFDSLFLQQNEQLDNRLDRLYDLLNQNCPRVRYTAGEWSRIYSLVTGLSPDRFEIQEPCQLLIETDTLAIVLNAAWQCRIHHWEQIYSEEIINQKAIKLCKKIINHED